MRRRRGVSPTAHSFLPCQKRHSAPFSLRGKEKAAGGKKKTAKGEFRISPFANPLKTTKKGAAAPFLGFSPGLGLCGICFQIVQTRDGCVFDRPAWQSKYSAIVSNVPCVEVRLCAIRDAALAGRTAFRLPYVKYSTGANEATRTVYRAIGKPNQTAAGRAFLAGSAIGEWYAEAKCFFRRDSAIWRPAVFSSISFLPRQKRYGPRSGGDGAQN